MTLEFMAARGASTHFPATGLAAEDLFADPAMILIVGGVTALAAEGIARIRSGYLQAAVATRIATAMANLSRFGKRIVKHGVTSNV
jgi:hypothetical protein